jgi:hypothetical protein
MAYKIKAQLDKRLARLEASVSAGKTSDVMTGAELDAAITGELWLLLASGCIVAARSGKWVVPHDKGIARYNVPLALVDAINRIAPIRDMAEAIGASGDASYTLTDDDGRTFELDVWQD